ncbi:MAG: DUF444 family protein, partial [Candidatus Wildermuthbacteria bacterium]|nr:DUF444 family protein [Candidatus Wildermuthbacteria bacterium]
KRTDGRFADALELLNAGKIVLTDESHVSVDPFPILHHEDYRYHKIEEDVTKESQAVVIAIMDVSASMTPLKKYFARTMIFWLVNFLRQIYKRVDIRFIAHDTEARIVDEENFFRVGESGGTHCYAGYELANSLIETDYPISQWNVYVWHFSDGEDGNTARSMEEARRLFERKINMFGYGEICPEKEYWPPELLKQFIKTFDLKEVKEEKDFTVHVSFDEKYPFLGVAMQEKKHIWQALKAFLKRDRWSS